MTKTQNCRAPLLVGAGVVALLAATERPAEACGGCFVGQSTTVVTDHRMILSVSPAASTLYDQIKYTGAPSSFAWVLPIAGTVTVGLSADVVFTTLDQQTGTLILPPPRNCPAFPSNCPSPPQSASAGAGFGGGADAGVTVLVHQVVGPYDTVQLAASNPTALQDWLQTNGYVIPADVAPVVNAYVSQHSNFLAMKLIPAADVQDMRPVRVTTTGANVALPLRMVAAGTGAVVGITLWILGEGRYEPQNFGSFTITTDELAWDWTQNTSNYTTLRTQKTAAGNGRVWEVESSLKIDPVSVGNNIRQGYVPGALPPQTAETSAQRDYLPEKDAQGNVTKSAVDVREEDIAALWSGISGGSARVTRIRADLAHAALDADLVVGAAKDQSEASNVRQVTHEQNQPLCAVYTDCQVTGQLPRDQAAASSTSNAAPNTGGNGGETFTCGASPRSTGTWAGGALGVLALAELFRRRSRPRRGG